MENDLLLEFKSFLQIDPTDTSEDAFLLEILLGAESFIYNYYGVAILQRNISELLYLVYADRVAYTKRGIIQQLVEMNYNRDTTNSFDDFYVEGNKIIFPSTYSFQENDRVMMTYVIGYDDITLVPRGLKAGLMMIGKKIYNDATKNSDMYSQISTGVKEAVKFIDSLPIVADNLLSAYKVFRL